MYTNNEIPDIKIRKKNIFTIATRKIKYLGINPTKEIKDLNSENYRTLRSIPSCNLPFVTAWMEPESVLLSEISQVVKDKYHTIAPISGT